jgi:hypothetical protein
VLTGAGVVVSVQASMLAVLLLKTRLPVKMLKKSLAAAVLLRTPPPPSLLRWSHSLKKAECNWIDRTLGVVLRGFKDPQLPNISTFMNQPYPLRALRTRKWGV